MKKLIAAGLLSVAMILSLAACGNKAEEAVSEAESEATSVVDAAEDAVQDAESEIEEVVDGEDEADSEAEEA